MEINKKENQKPFYRVLRNLRKDKQVELEQIKDKNGQLLIDINDEEDKEINVESNQER